MPNQMAYFFCFRYWPTIVENQVAFDRELTMVELHPMNPGSTPRFYTDALGLFYAISGTGYIPGSISMNQAKNGESRHLTLGR